jgi:predicted nucleotidyltransferase
MITQLIEERLGLSREAIADCCKYWQIEKMALFGSVLRADFHAASDIDILLRFSPQARQGLLTLAQIKRQLEELTGRKIDLLLWESLENSENWLRRSEILKTAQIIYG